LTAVAPPLEATVDPDAARLAELGYRQQLSRRLRVFGNASIGFAAISPVVGLYAVVLVGTLVAGPAWVWVLPVALAGQCLLIAVYSELASEYPIAGGAYQWSRRLLGGTYGWMSGWVAICAYAVANTTIAYLGAPWALTLLGIEVTPNRIVAMGMVLVVVGIIAVVVAAQTTRMSKQSPSALEVRAMEEFNLGNYSTALPMLRQVQSELGANASSGTIDESIRVCEKNLAKAPTTGPAATQPLNATRKPLPPPSASVQEIAIKDLGNFDFDGDKGGNIPDDVKAWKGTKVRVKGFMIPMDQAENISQFALVPSLFSCCFGQPPQVQHTIVVHVPKGKRVGYYPDEISVEGKLTVEEKKEDGFIVSIFEIECSSVKPAAK
jgi:hypothetical protein